jgi:predicted phage terminase large subunit-like protein
MSAKSSLLDLIPDGAMDAVLSGSLAFFVRAAFAEISPGVELVWDPYLDLICSKLEGVANGDIRRLIITMPPRHLKSVCVSVALPAYFLGHNPSAEVLAVSYGDELSKTFAEDTRTVMQSAFYKRIFDTRLVSGRPALKAMKTTQRGVRRSTSMDGVATGVGADLLIFDDPQKANDAMSAAMRATTNESYRTTFTGRFNNPAKSATIIVMQRLHEDDFVGFVLGLGAEWDVVNLPAIAEEDEAYPYKTFLGRHVYRRAEGAALHPKRIPLVELQHTRAEVGEAIWASQYMQRPAPAGGGLVKTAWFKRYNEADLPQSFDRIVQSWDTANTTAEWSDYTVCTTWGRKEKRTYLLDVFRKKLLYPDLKREIITQADLHKPHSIFIEDRASGTQVIQDLKRDSFSKIEARKPTADKEIRMAGQTAQIENGLVYVPHEAHWLAEYLHEMSVFPNGKYDDQVDSTSQALDGLGNPQIKGAAFLELARQANREREDRRNGVHVGKIEYQPGSMEYAAEQTALAAEAERAKAAEIAAPRRIALVEKPVFVPALSLWQPGSLEWAVDQVKNATAKDAFDASWA